MARSLEELTAEYAKKEKKLKDEKELLFKQAKARAAKKNALNNARARKNDAHLKILIGGFIIAEMKSKKETEMLTRLLKTVRNKLSEKDKTLINDLKNQIEN